MSYRRQHILPLEDLEGHTFIAEEGVYTEIYSQVGEELVVKYKTMLSTMGEQLEELQDNLYAKETLCVSMLQILSEPIFWCNEYYEIEGCNEGFCDFFDLARMDVLQEHVAKVLPEEIARVVCTEETIVGTDMLIEFEYKRVYVAFLLSKTPIRKKDTSIQGHMIHLVNITEIRKKDEQLVYHATHDELTGLYNRFEAQRRMQEFLDAEKQFSVILLNVDKFSDINKIHVPLGDRYLVILAQRLESIFGEHFIARISGDEFLILVEKTAIETVQAMIEEAMESLLPPIVLDEHEFLQSCTFSITRAPMDGITVDELLQNIMVTMEYGKQTYGSKIHFFTPSLLAENKMRYTREEEIKRAIIAKDIINVYQPRIDVQTGKIHSFEALARIRSVDGRMRMPSEFIAEAEYADLIQELGKQVLENACIYLKQLQIIYEGISISVNISAKQFSYDLVAMIDEVVQATGVDPSLLELEITESIMIRDVKKARRILEQIALRGIRIAIDDFGKGYSSLYYIKDLPIDTLKIDKDFTQDALHNPRSAAIVRTVILLGNELGMQVVAEGIETEEQYNNIQVYKCNQLQGDYISIPLLEADATAWLTSLEYKKIGIFR